MLQRILFLGLLVLGLEGSTYLRADDKKEPDDPSEIYTKEVLQDALIKSEQFELFALSLRGGGDEDKGKKPETFQGYTVLGKLTIKDADTRKKLADTFPKPPKKGDIEREPLKYLCFDPRHGIRLSIKGKLVDLLICFQCREFHVCDEKKTLAVRPISIRGYTVFNKILGDANIKFEQHKIKLKTYIPEEIMNALSKSEEFELYSLRHKLLGGEDTSKEGSKYNYYFVLGKMTVKDADTRKKIVEAFQKSAEVEDDEIESGFAPRHGIRFKKDGKTIDFVISFESSQVRVYINDKFSNIYPINDSARDTFNKVLKDAKIKIDAPEKK